jgi:hypothetical protein
LCLKQMPLKYLHYILVIGLLAGCSQSTPVDDRFALNPPSDEYFDYRMIQTESEEHNGSKSSNRFIFDFSLKKTHQGDTGIHFRLYINKISITAPAITMAETKKGTVIVMPSGRQVMLTTEDSVARDDKGKILDEFYENKARIMPLLKGDSFNVDIEPWGEARQVEGFDKITENVSKATGIGRGEVKQYLRDYISDVAIQDMLNQLFFFLPGKKIQQGDSWVKNVVLVTKSPVKYSHKITVDSLKHKVYLSLQSIVSARVSDDIPPYAEGELTGKIVAWPHTGLVDYIETTEQITTPRTNSTITRQRTINAIRF